MQQPVQYIGFGGGDLANYWPASYTPAVVSTGQFARHGDLTQAFRHNAFRLLHYEVASGTGATTNYLTSKLGLLGVGI